MKQNDLDKRLLISMYTRMAPKCIVELPRVYSSNKLICHWNNNYSSDKKYIFGDSQAVLLGLKSIITISSHIDWIPWHKGLERNEEAKEIAGAVTSLNDHQLACHVSKCICPQYNFNRTHLLILQNRRNFTRLVGIPTDRLDTRRN